MVARVALELVLRKEFDYFIPPQLEGRVFVGSRVKVPFGSRLVLGSVTALLPESTHPGLKSINKVIGEHAQIPEKVFQLARWISEYYCAPPRCHTQVRPSRSGPTRRTRLEGTPRRHFYR